jgi:hypothetical protein
LEKPFLEAIAVLESGGKWETTIMEGHGFAKRPEPGSGRIHCYYLYFHEQLASSITDLK